MTRYTPGTVWEIETALSCHGGDYVCGERLSRSRHANDPTTPKNIPKPGAHRLRDVDLVALRSLRRWIAHRVAAEVAKGVVQK